MAGPYTGTWRAAATQQAGYTGAAKWGTGINPVHSIRTEGPNIITASKLNFDPAVTPGGQETDILAENYAWDNTWNPDPEQPDYNTTSANEWEYGSQTGTADRPSWGSEMADVDAPESGVGLPNPEYAGRQVPIVRGSTQNDTDNRFPAWGGSRKPGPAGRFIRAVRRGSDQAVRVLPLEAVDQGWTNKTHGIIADSRPADDSQVFMQTSMTQRYKTRAGSQNIGSQSTFAAPVDSRVTGQKVKNWSVSTSARHWDMLPYEQEDYPRPFLSRQAGTGYREWMYPNDMYVSPTIQREPSADPEMGPVAGASVAAASASNPDYGYSYEDNGMGFF